MPPKNEKVVSLYFFSIQKTEINSRYEFLNWVVSKAHLYEKLVEKQFNTHIFLLVTIVSSKCVS